MSHLIVAVGALVGDVVGLALGDSVGGVVGSLVGAAVGCVLGEDVGSVLGDNDGDSWRGWTMPVPLTRGVWARSRRRWVRGDYLPCSRRRHHHRPSRKARL